MREQQSAQPTSVAGSQPTTTTSGLPPDHIQVRGSTKPLLRCIRDGEIATPLLVSYPQWLKWRAGPGQRPTKARDGYFIPKALEATLWRSVMQELFGSDWAIRCCSTEAETAGDPDAEAVGDVHSATVGNPGDVHTGNAADRSVPGASDSQQIGSEQAFVTPSISRAPSEISWFILRRP